MNRQAGKRNSAAALSRLSVWKERRKFRRQGPAAAPKAEKPLSIL
jgi:hypothetical protein